MSVNKGDIVRVRALDSGADWCICEVALVSGDALGLLIVEGALRCPQGIIIGGFPVLIVEGRAFEALTNTELEIDKRKVTVQ